MNANFGGSQFGSLKLVGGSNFLTQVAVLGDASDHGGSLTTTNQDGTVKLAGVVIAVDQCNHSCPITGHGTTQVTAITKKSKINGKLIITHGATAGCGAMIVPTDRKVYVE
jgi:uncharacterized Zn-binding protein involved in type VI secretion